MQQPPPTLTPPHNYPPIEQTTIYTRQTAQRLLTQAEQQSKSAPILYTSRLIVRELTPRDPVSEANACLWYIRHHIRYQRDPDGIEVVFSPTELVRMIEQYGRFAEDCESQSSLLYSLLRAIGFAVRFAGYNFTNTDKIDHMNVECKIDDIWYMLDPILPPCLVNKMLHYVCWKETISLLQWR